MSYAAARADGTLTLAGLKDVRDTGAEWPTLHAAVYGSGAPTHLFRLACAGAKTQPLPSRVVDTAMEWTPQMRAWLEA